MPTSCSTNTSMPGHERRRGDEERYRQLREASLAQLMEGHFGEYYEPFTGEPLGSMDQSWTAAVALEWLADPESS